MTSQPFILATAGHVDHGKSALIKALTGADPDRLPEEKARGITIDLGFTHLELPASKEASVDTYSVGIVDVPGHEDFVKNMVAGVGSIDLALIVVAADDGWMPQTEEHVQILSYLGVQQAVVALTKMDLVESDEEFFAAVIQDELRQSPFADAPVVRTSSTTGRGLNELKQALARVLAGLPPPRDFGKPRLPVDRVFSLKGIGTVVTGTLTGGRLSRGQTVFIQPAERPARIRSLQAYNRDVDSGSPGQRIALNLPDCQVASAHQPGIQRGDVVTLEEAGRPSPVLDAFIERSPRLKRDAQGAGRPLKEGTMVRVHYGSGNFPARVFPHPSDPVLPGDRRLVQLRFETPVFVFAGDRFIVRDWSEEWTLAGGTVLDPDAARKPFRRPDQQSFLNQRAVAPDDLSLLVTSQFQRDKALPRAQLLEKSRFSQSEIVSAIDELIRQGRLISLGHWVADGPWWKQFRHQAAELIDDFHRAHPERLGKPLNELRAALAPEHAASELFDALIADLVQGEFEQDGTIVRRHSHQPGLPPQLQSAGQKIRAALEAKPFEPPSRKELTPDRSSEQALRFFIDSGQAVEINPELVLPAESYRRITERITQFIRENGPASVSQLRQAIGASRRIAVPVLERLDRLGVTRRQGDVRVLGPHADSAP